MDKPWQLILPNFQNICVIFRLPKACVKWLTVPLLILLLIKNETTFHYDTTYGLIPQQTSFDVFTADRSCLLNEVVLTLPVSQYYIRVLNLTSSAAEKQTGKIVSVEAGHKPSELQTRTVTVRTFFLPYILKPFSLNLLSAKSA